MDQSNPFTCWPVLLLALVAMPSQAQVADQPNEAQDQAQDHVLVISRTVMPRAAYRGLPAEQNPVRSQVAVFPTRAFDQAMDSLMLGLAASENDLAERPNTALAPVLSQALGVRLDAAVHGQHGAAGGPGLTGIGPLGGIGASTSGLGGRIDGSVQRAMQPLLPGGK